MKMIKCQQGSFDLLHTIGFKRLFMPNVHRSEGDYAACGLDSVFKYYLLNKIAPELGMDIDPKDTTTRIIQQVIDKQMRVVVEKLESLIDVESA